MDQEEVLGQLVVIGGGTAVGQENGVLALQRYRELLHQLSGDNSFVSASIASLVAGDRFEVRDGVSVPGAERRQATAKKFLV